LLPQNKLRTLRHGRKRWVLSFLLPALIGCGAKPELVERAAADAERFGLVALETRAATSERGPRIHAAAYFWQEADQRGTGCEVIEQVAHCEVTRCVPTAAVATLAKGFAWLSAGTIDILGTKIEFSFAETADGNYAATLPTQDLSLWDGGEQVTAVAAGSQQFPSFEVSLTAPRRIELVTPKLPQPVPGVDPRTGTRLEWSAPERELVYVDVEELRAVPLSPSSEVGVRCAFPAEAGVGVVPSAAFAHFSDPSILSGYRFWVSTETRAQVPIDSADLTFLASTVSARFDAPVTSLEK
jgi:hypothetical protein